MIVQVKNAVCGLGNLITPRNLDNSVRFLESFLSFVVVPNSCYLLLHSLVFVVGYFHRRSESFQKHCWMCRISVMTLFVSEFMSSFLNEWLVFTVFSILFFPFLSVFCLMMPFEYFSVKYVPSSLS